MNRIVKYSTKQIYSLILSGGFAKLEGKIEYPCHLRGMRYISIGRNSVILKNTILNAWESHDNQKFTPKILIGENSFIGEYSHISSCQSVTIGNNVLTGRYVYISDNNHGNFSREMLDVHPLSRPLHIKGPVVIEDNVWIGEHVCILSGVKIGKGSIVSANTVVTKDVPPYSLVGGTPGRIIKTYQK